MKSSVLLWCGIIVCLIVVAPRSLRGENAEPMAEGFRTDVIAALRELRVPIDRWPGGCFASGYHWEAGVGKHRLPTDDMAWGVVDPNTFGIDEYVHLCRLLEWQPYICNNAGNGTVAEMKSWVEYCNARQGKYADERTSNGHHQPWDVRIWSIGNENWGAHEIGYKPIEQWSPLVLEAALAMKAADPTIQLSAAALPDRKWMLPMLAQSGQHLDYISLHRYGLPLHGRNDMPDYLTCIMESEGPERLIVGVVDILEESGHRGRIKIASDEWSLRGRNHPGFPRQAVSCRMAVDGRPLLDGRYAAIVLAGDSPEAFNDIEHPDRVVPEATHIDCVHGTITLPAHSLSIVKHATP